MKKTFKFTIVTSCLALAASFATAYGSAITAGDLVIYRVGDGAAALGTTAAAVFLDEYSPSGTLVQSIALPSATGSLLTAVGTATTEGIISRSQDGSSLIFTGYRKVAGGASPASDNYATTARVIGTLTAAGTADTSTTVINDNGSTAANTIRSATSVNGTSAFWTSTSTRVGYYGSGLGSAAGTVQIDARNSRQINLSGNTLFAANGAAITGKVQTYGTLPTGATAATPIVSLTTADAINGFSLFDLNPGVAGDDTMYALSTVANLLLKYTYDGSVWTANGSIAAGSAQNLTGYASGSTVNLFLTSGSTLYGYSDASGIGGTETGALSTITTAGINTAFRGIGMFAAPVPEPSTIALAGIGGVAALLTLRRRK